MAYYKDFMALGLQKNNILFYLGSYLHLHGIHTKICKSQLQPMGNLSSEYY